jgi:hypothetical protein
LDETGKLAFENYEVSKMQLASASAVDKSAERKRLRRLRRHAARWGFRVVRVFADFSLVTVLTEPPRAVCGLRGVDLATIEGALRLPFEETSPALKHQPPSETAIYDFIDRAGAEAVLNVLDRLTAPATPIAAE